MERQTKNQPAALKENPEVAWAELEAQEKRRAKLLEKLHNATFAVAVVIMAVLVIYLMAWDGMDSTVLAVLTSSSILMAGLGLMLQRKLDRRLREDREQVRLSVSKDSLMRWAENVALGAAVVEMAVAAAIFCEEEGNRNGFTAAVAALLATVVAAIILHVLNERKEKEDRP